VNQTGPRWVGSLQAKPGAENLQFNRAQIGGGYVLVFGMGIERKNQAGVVQPVWLGRRRTTEAFKRSPFRHRSKPCAQSLTNEDPTMNQQAAGSRYRTRGS